METTDLTTENLKKIIAELQGEMQTMKERMDVLEARTKVCDDLNKAEEECRPFLGRPSFGEHVGWLVRERYGPRGEPGDDD
jgi:hypothetical protein